MIKIYFLGFITSLVSFMSGSIVMFSMFELFNKVHFLGLICSAIVVLAFFFLMMFETTK